MESDRFAAQFPAEGILCTPCRLAPPPFERAVAYAEYQDELRTLLHLLKYERMRPMARPLGAMLAEAIENMGLTGDVLLVTVPLYKPKQRQRGYNQTVLLADEAVAHLRSRGTKMFHVEHSGLIRVRQTESQFALSPHARRRNLKGAFRATRTFEGQTVLLVDDIYTTGATARECAGVLRRAKAEKVYVATLARAQAERVAFWGAAHT